MDSRKLAERRLFVTGGPAATQALGRRIGERLFPGSVVALIGELGSGKTCFTKGLCAGLGISPRCVNSPTFAFVNEYKGRLPVLHLDLYRIETAEMALEVGILDYLDRAGSGVAIIEWADKVLPLLADGYLVVRFSVLSARKREIRLTALGREFGQLLGEMGEE